MGSWDGAAWWNCATVNMQGEVWGFGGAEGSDVDVDAESEDMVRVQPV